MTATPAWLAAAEALIDRGIGASTQGAALARRLEGTALRVDIVGMTSIRVSVVSGRLALIAVDRNAADDANAALSGSPMALVHLLRTRGAAAARGAARSPVQIRGDAEIANAYRELIGLARPDLEEELSRIVGDLPARRLSQLARRTMHWARNARRTAGENIAEYLQEESRDLVNRPELEEFLRGVDDLRETTDRVAARLAQLERRLKDSA